MRFLLQKLLVVFFITLPIIVNAQFFYQPTYPQDLFQWPVGAVKAIVANFGELRPNHYHMGLDCRTEQVVNKPIYAAADGYIAKIKIEPFGFGRAIYINHPGGYTTLYAHLNDFYGPLEKYITQKQYELKSWAVFLDIPQNLFVVKKGQQIAWSGNTGGSQGPHLHFEIRETSTDKVLNPLLFNMPITDKIAPDIIRLAIYDRSKSTYEQTPKLLPLKKTGVAYSIPSENLMVYTEKTSFAITAFDRYTGSTNHNGIYQAVMSVDNVPVSGFQLNNISYDETRYLNAHIDYKTKINGGPYLQHLSRLPGNPAQHYKTDASNGIVSLEPGQSKKIKIEAWDANNNKSALIFTLTRSTDVKNPQATTAGILFKPNEINIFESESVKFYLPENALYDSFYFIYSKINPSIGKPIYQLNNHSVPLQTAFTVKIKDGILFLPTSKMIMKRFWGEKEEYKKAVAATEEAEQGWYKAEFKQLGNFQLIADNEPPEITPIGFKDGMDAAKLSRIIFRVKDNTEEIANFTALLDGKWLRFTNDKAKLFIYTFDEYCTPGQHELKIIAEDLAGNKIEKIYHFTR